MRGPTRSTRLAGAVTRGAPLEVAADVLLMQPLGGPLLGDHHDVAILKSFATLTKPLPNQALDPIASDGRAHLACNGNPQARRSWFLPVQNEEQEVRCRDPLP